MACIFIQTFIFSKMETINRLKNRNQIRVESFLALRLYFNHLKTLKKGYKSEELETLGIEYENI